MKSAPTRPPPIFIGDHPAMDFLNTIAFPYGEAIEWLASGNDLLDWLESAKLIDTAAVRHFHSHADRKLDNAVKDARSLREWLRSFVEVHKGEPLQPGALAELKSLNRLLACGDVFHQVTPIAASADRNGGNGLRLERKHHWIKPSDLLQPLALAIGDLVCHADFRLIRRCENADCTLMFYDCTKSHARRWCSMAVCGNRAKVAAFRARQT